MYDLTDSSVAVIQILHSGVPMRKMTFSYSWIVDEVLNSHELTIEEVLLRDLAEEIEDIYASEALKADAEMLKELEQSDNYINAISERRIRNAIAFYFEEVKKNVPFSEIIRTIVKDCEKEFSEDFSKFILNLETTVQNRIDQIRMINLKDRSEIKSELKKVLTAIGEGLTSFHYTNLKRE